LQGTKYYPYNLIVSAVEAWVDNAVLLARCKRSWVKIKGYGYVMAVVDHNLRESDLPGRHDEVMSKVWEDIGAAFRGQGDSISTALVVELFAYLTEEQKLSLKTVLVEALTKASEFCEVNNIEQRYNVEQRQEAIISSYEHVRDHPEHRHDAVETNKATYRDIVRVLNKIIKNKAVENTAAANGAKVMKRLVRLSDAASPEAQEVFTRERLRLLVTNGQVVD
jgi:hypothetical protein